MKLEERIFHLILPQVIGAEIPLTLVVPRLALPNPRFQGRIPPLHPLHLSTQNSGKDARDAALYYYWADYSCYTCMTFILLAALRYRRQGRS